MKCEICGNEYDGVFCDKCGWEEMNILDDEYLEIFNKRKEIYKKQINSNTKFVNFIEKLINKYTEYLNSNINLAKIFIEDVLEILKDFDENYYIEFLLAKFYIYISEKNKLSENILKELESLYTLMNEGQKKSFEKLKAFYEKSF